MNNDNITYDNKCIIHPTQDILFICSNCDNEPICIICITSKDLHRTHGVDLIDLDKTTIILNEFKENYKKLDQFKTTNVELDNQSTKLFNEIETAHTDNLESIKLEFCQLRTILNTIEQDTIRQLVTRLDENQDLNLKIKLQIEENTKAIKTILDKHYETIDDYTPISICDNSNHQHIEIAKHNQQIKTFLKNEITKSDILKEYTIPTCEFNTSSIDTFKDSIKTIVTITNTPAVGLTIDKRLEILQSCNIPMVNGSKWAAIDLNWFKKWSSDIDYTRKELGPIDNNNLLQYGEFKIGLKKMEHFTLIPNKSWFKLKEAYGGGPDIIRQVVNDSVDLRIPFSLQFFKSSEPNKLITHHAIPNETIGSLKNRVCKLFNLSPDNVKIWVRENCFNVELEINKLVSESRLLNNQKILLEEK